MTQQIHNVTMDGLVLVEKVLNIISKRFDIEYDDMLEYVKIKVDFEDLVIKNNTVRRAQKLTLKNDDGHYIYFDMRANRYYDGEKKETEIIAVE